MYYGPRRKKLRLDGYDYSLPGEYFVTICTKGLRNYFGRVVNTQVELSKIGKIANKCWCEIPNHFEGVKLDEYIVMPNHVHGVVVNTPSVGSWHANSLRRERRFQLLPCIIGSYKSAVTKFANRIQNNFQFAWQRSYFDHIIQTDEALDNIREYIRLNPLNWEINEGSNFLN